MEISMNGKHCFYVISVLAVLYIKLPLTAASIDVQVFNESTEQKKPIQNVRCLLLNGRPGSAMLQKARTDKDGILEFTNLEKGTYFLQFTSEKFKTDGVYAHLSLPNLIGPVKVNESDISKKVTVKCVEAASIQGTLSYEGNTDLSSTSIFSYSGQQHAIVDKEGNFRLGGLYPGREAKVKVNLISFENRFIPLYLKIFYVEGERLEGGRTTNVGQIEFPYPQKNESIHMQFKDRKNQKLSYSDMKGLDQKLLMTDMDQSLRLSLSTTQLELMMNDKTVEIRLPAGRYQAWWRGYKKKHTYRFQVKKAVDNRIEIDVPSALPSSNK